MELQNKDSQIQNYEPFEIVHNARQNSKHNKSTAAKSRKNSTISLADEKQKKIKKKPRKLTEYLDEESKWYDQGKEHSEKKIQNEDNIFSQTLFQFGQENITPQQKLKQQKEQIVFLDKQQEDFYFHDCQGQKGIMQGLGDENSLGKQFNFDFFNPEKYSR